MEPSGNDILDNYRNTLNKLKKKRFLRSPNITEASDSFTSLALQCEDLEASSYASLCWMSASRCQDSLGNVPAATTCLLKAGRCFLDAELTDARLGLVSPYTENLQGALSCFHYVQLEEKSPQKVGLNLKTAGALEILGETDCAEGYLRKAVDSAEGSLEGKSVCLTKLVSYFICKRDFTSALDVLTDLVHLLECCPINGERKDILLECEISRVFLLLILRPTPQRLEPKLAKILEKYAWGESKEKSLKECGMSENLFLLMQSLVMICQSSDTSNLPDVEGELWSFLSNEQKDLLRILVRIYLRV